MPRRKRVATGGYVFHVLNRATARRRIFDTDGDYAAFERVLAEALKRVPVRLLSYCIMPNHWHLVLWPKRGADNDLSEFMRWMTVTHTQRWHTAHGTAGEGPLYQGRFKSFPMQGDEHFLTVRRYVERNALRANLVATADQWRWSSLWHRLHPNSGHEMPLTDWPVQRPRNWNKLIATPQTEPELEALRRAIKRGQPFGNDAWVKRTAGRLELESTLRPRGRPKKVRTRKT